MTRSICLAVYNGEKYIKEQLDSVIKQLDGNDEVIVVNDCSKDRTVKIIESYNDNRIKIYNNDINLGHVKSFEKAISLAKNDIIYLCDQDDIWFENRFQVFETIFSENNSLLLISSNSLFIDGDGNKIDINMSILHNKDSNQFKKNIMNIFKGNIGYYGCAMAMKKDLIKTILPIPSYVESHDLWIAMAANIISANYHLEEPTFYRRIHGANDSLKNRPLLKKMYSRYIFLKSYKEILKKI